MADPACTRLIQICPNDRPPFLDICAAHRKAAEVIGMDGGDYFLGPTAGLAPNHGFVAQAHYLNCGQLGDNRRLSSLLRAMLPETQQSLVLCHRYRAYKAFLGTGLPAARTLVVAHGYGFFKRRCRRLALRLTRRNALFAGVSPGVAAELAHTTGSAGLWPNTLDVEAVRYLDRAAARRALGLPEEGFVCGVVGRLHYKKRPLLALEAFRVFLQRGGEGRLVFVGAGDLRGRLEAASQGLPVRLLGFVAQAPRMMKAFDVVLMTSSDEAFGMVLLEAMAAGVPVVAPRQPGPESVLGDLGHYFEGAQPQAIAAALRGASASPAGGGLERAQREFSIDALAKRLDRLRLGSAFP